MVHITAIIDKTAKIAENVEIGAYSIIGPNVEIAEDTWIGPHVVIPCNTKIGKNNKIYQFASIGGENQDLLHDDKPIWLEIGDNNVFHEFVTINRGSVKENCLTKIGNNNLFMAYTHVAHDCTVGNHTVFANNATLAGHIIVDDYATIGAFCAIHQFCNIGAYSFISRGAMVVKDVLAYLMISGNDANVYGLNTVGLQRNGFSKDTIRHLQKAYKIIFRNNLTVEQVKTKLTELVVNCNEVKIFIDGLQRAERGICR